MDIRLEIEDMESITKILTERQIEKLRELLYETLARTIKEMNWGKIIADNLDLDDITIGIDTDEINSIIEEKIGEVIAEKLKDKVIRKIRKAFEED